MLWGLIVHGPRFGVTKERHRILGRIQTKIKLLIAFFRHTEGRVSTPQSDPESFRWELALAREATAKFERNFRKVPRPAPAVFQQAFPVLVRSDDTQPWERGIFHGVGDDGYMVATDRDATGKVCKVYTQVRADCENSRPVAITTSLFAWQQQEDDPVNALRGAPLGTIGRISIKKTSIGDRRRTSAMGFHAAECVDVTFPPTAMFTFYLDLTEPIGFAVRSKWGRVVVSHVVPLSQSHLAGVSSKCRVCRVGGTSVRSPDEFKEAITKRRIVSVQLRKQALEQGRTDITLTDEDKALLAHEGLAALIAPAEFNALSKELSEDADGFESHCTISFQDHSFSITRRLPTELTSFHALANFKPDEPFWDTYGIVISCYKSSSRHFEQWATIRKVIAVLVEVLMASSISGVQRATQQASVMLCVCFVALILQVRLSPYDDLNVMNEFNAADALISNNSLETAFLSLQIMQLSIGLISVLQILPNSVVAFVYISIILVGIGFTIVALSSDAAKAAHVIWQVFEPWILALIGSSDDDIDKLAHEKHRNRQRQSDSGQRRSENRKSLARDLLLKIGNDYEASKSSKVSFFQQA